MARETMSSVFPTPVPKATLRLPGGPKAEPSMIIRRSQFSGLWLVWAKAKGAEPTWFYTDEWHAREIAGYAGNHPGTERP
jgi:hypothetical protein